jgi:hypothetical protein
MDAVFQDRMSVNDLAERAKAHFELAMVLFQAGQDRDALVLANTGIEEASVSGIQDFLLVALAVRLEIGWSVEGSVSAVHLRQIEKIALRLRDRRTLTRIRIFETLEAGDLPGLAQHLENALSFGFSQEILFGLLLVGHRYDLEALQLAADMARSTQQEFSAREKRDLPLHEPNPQGWQTRLAILAANLRSMSQF